MNNSQVRHKNDIKEVEYTPDSHLHHRFRVFWEMTRELIHSRELTWRFFMRDLSARYRQSIFGYIWAVVPSIVTVIVFTYLNKTRILPIGDTDIPYPVYVLIGMTVWQLFSTGLTLSAQSLVQAGSFITKINFSRETLVLAVFGQSVFNFLIRLVLVVVVFIWFRVVPTWTVILFPFMLIPLALMTIGFGFLLAMANGVFRDIGNAISLVMTIMMFLTPIVYPPPTQWPNVLINYLNPVSPFIIAARDLATKGTLSQPEGLLLGSIVGFLVFLAGWRIFHLAMPRVAERI